jgi:copper chaperone CopZ
MKSLTFDIPNISCNHCVHTIETEIADLAGVRSVHADVNTRRAIIMYDEPATEEKIRELLAEINYPALDSPQH